MVPISYYVALSAVLFGLGAVGFVFKRNVLTVFMSIELMLNAVNLSIIAFGAFTTSLRESASVIALFVIAAAAAEATIGLAIVIAIYRNRKTPLVDEYDAMRQ